MTDDHSKVPAKYRGNVPGWKHVSYPVRRRIKSWAMSALIVLSAIVVLFPVFWIYNSSIRPFADVTRDPTIFPREVTVQHYMDLWYFSSFPTYLWNSIVVTVGVVVLTTTLATLGGYGLTRIQMRFKRTFARGILFGYMFPPILLGIPMFIVWNQAGMTNTYTGVILALTALSLAFALWLMWRFFLNVPYTLEEAARMNGATRFEAFVQIALPIAKPGIIAAAIFSFAVAWGDYTLATILLSDADMFVLTVGIEQDLMAAGQRPDFPLAMAAVSVALIPPLLFVYFLQKYLLLGFGGGELQ